MEHSVEPSGPVAGKNFNNGIDRHIFRFTYEGEARPLHGYLLERYGYGRDGEWSRGFYPGRVRLNDEPVDGDTLVRPDDRIAYLHLRREEPHAPPLGSPLFEDEWLLALMKNDQVPVNPSGVYFFTSMAIMAREQLGNAELTPLHRLDLETSGPVLFARRSRDLKTLHRMFLHNTIHKRYRALVHGRFPETLRDIRGRIVPDTGSAIHTKLRLEPVDEGELPPPDRQRFKKTPAELSHTRVLTCVHVEGGRYSELELQPVTGKTNQLRVHLAHLGHPVVGDKKYHPDEGVFLDWYTHRNFNRLREKLLLPRQALHCEALAFDHPFTGLVVNVNAPPRIWLNKIGGLAGDGRAGQERNIR